MTKQIRPQLEILQHKKIKYTIQDGKMFRVWYPFNNKLFYCTPMNSIEEEEALDKERKNKPDTFWNNVTIEEDPNDAYDATREQSFSAVDRSLDRDADYETTNERNF